ncbi:MAG: PEGA domain-containing protein [Planctomycetia bacterium]|nr:PEGA domain-containing protein [Planctomycetia bacterium]
MNFLRVSLSENPFTFRKVCCLVLCLTILTTCGCLRRRMTINSNPPGATVYVDGHQIGKTPVSTDFTYYGTRNIRLEMDNYQTMVVKQKVAPPWYEFPPLDFFTETFSANEIKDHHVWTYDLQQRTISSDDQIMDRAKNMAFEASRSVNPDGTLGTPITSDNYRPRSSYTVGDNPDAGQIPVNAPQTTPLAPPAENYGRTTSVPVVDVPANQNTQNPYVQPSQTAPLAPGQTVPSWNSAPSVTQPTAPTSNPNTFPRGSADWDTPNRYPHGN